MPGHVQRLDERIVRALASQRRQPVTTIAIAVSHAGRGGVLWGALAPALLPARMRAIAISTGAVAAAYLGSLTLARVLGRDRPCQSAKVRALVDCPDGPSLPSDQAAAAFAGAIALGSFRPGARPWLLGAATAISTARVVAGVHYPSDVLVGAVWGSAIAKAAVRTISNGER